MKIILTILILIIVIRLFSRLILRILANRIRKYTMPGSESTDDHISDSPKNNKKKIFRKEEGDYVDFEELEK